jgi:hypothetical protein
MLRAGKLIPSAYFCGARNDTVKFTEELQPLVRHHRQNQRRRMFRIVIHGIRRGDETRF